MVRYKLVDKDNNIIGVATDADLRYMQYNEDHSDVQYCKNIKFAFGVAYKGQIYSINSNDTNYPYIKLIIIGNREYQYIESKLKEDEQILPDKEVNESLKSQITDTSTLEFAKNYKINEMKDMCNKAITNGVDVMLSDGQIYHFDLTIEDQLNLQNVQYQLLQNQTSIPFHSKNGSFKYYDVSDLILILTQANSHILYHNAYFNSLKSYIKSIEKIDQINSVNYGISIPNQYKSEVLHQLEK